MSSPGLSGDDSLLACKPITLRIMLGADHQSPDRMIACLCGEKAVDVLRRLVSVVDEVAPGSGLSASMSGTSFLLRANHHTSSGMAYSSCDGIATCLLQVCGTHCRRENLWDLSRFIDEVKAMGCFCTGREICLMVLKSYSLAQIRSAR